MRVTAALCLAVLALFSTACPSSPPPKAVAVTRARDVVPLIKDARLTKPVAFDGGKLRLDPINGKPKMSEDAALRQWVPSAGGLPGGVVVVYARATLGIPITADPNVGVTLRTIPRFARRPVWAIFFYSGGPTSCPTDIGGTKSSRPPIPRGTPYSQSVDLIAADGADSVTYNSGGITGTCTQEVAAPNAEPTWYVYSARWRVGITGNPHETVVVSLPACSALWSIEGPEDPQGVWMYKVLLKRLRVRPPCRTDRKTLTLDYARVRGPYGNPAIETVQHGPLGPTVVHIVSPKIKYFDGATREFKTS